MEQSSFNRLCLRCSNCVTTAICMHKHRNDLYNMHDAYWKLKWKYGNFITFSFTLWFYEIDFFLLGPPQCEVRAHTHTYQDHLYFAVVCMSLAPSISADCQANKVLCRFIQNATTHTVRHNTVRCHANLGEIERMIILRAHSVCPNAILHNWFRSVFSAICRWSWSGKHGMRIEKSWRKEKNAARWAHTEWN